MWKNEKKWKNSNFVFQVAKFDRSVCVRIRRFL